MKRTVSSQKLKQALPLIMLESLIRLRKLLVFIFQEAGKIRKKRDEA